MKKLLILMALALFVLPMALAGCGEQDAAVDAEKAATETATEAAADAAETVLKHDCDGGCGMKDVPMDKLTEVHGKFYCAGCAKKAEEDHGHSHG